MSVPLLIRTGRIERTSYGGVEKLASRVAHNHKVGGSSPSPATNEEELLVFTVNLTVNQTLTQQD